MAAGRNDPTVHVHLSQVNYRWLMGHGMSAAKAMAALIDYARRRGLTIEAGREPEIREPE